jgi:class 3 adenylate cyclase
VGKTYTACAGLKSTEKDYAGKIQHENSTRRAIDMAIAMMNFIEECVFDEDSEIKIKIGIHYGRIIAGIIGHHKPQFSLVGESVSIANRCCSTAEDGKIALTEGAFDQIATDKFKFDKKKVEVVLKQGKEPEEELTFVLKRGANQHRGIRKLNDGNQNMDRLKSLITQSAADEEAIKNELVNPNLNDLDNEYTTTTKKPNMSIPLEPGIPLF